MTDGGDIHDHHPNGNTFSVIDIGFPYRTGSWARVKWLMQSMDEVVIRLGGRWMPDYINNINELLLEEWRNKRIVSKLKDSIHYVFALLRTYTACNGLQ